MIAVRNRQKLPHSATTVSVQTWERLHPVPDELRHLMTSSFSQQYNDAAYYFALGASDESRRQLSNFLSGVALEVSSVSRVGLMTPSPDLVFPTARGSINFNRCFFPALHSKRISHNLTESPGTDRVFAKVDFGPEVVRHRAKSVEEWTVHRYLRSEVAERLLPICRGYTSILDELHLYLSKKSTPWLVDDTYSDPLLGTRAAAAATKIERETDHLGKGRDVPKLPRQLAQTRHFEVKTGQSVYRELFQVPGPTTRPKLERRPDHGVIAKFPSVPRFERDAVSVGGDDLSQNAKWSKLNRSIFEGQTCL